MAWSLSARFLRIANIMSCLRSDDAFSTCTDSAKFTSSAGVFFFSSARCMRMPGREGAGRTSDRPERIYGEHAGRFACQSEVLGSQNVWIRALCACAQSPDVREG